jgi:hypothetical protein
MMMQNWAHVVRVFEHLNLVPSDTHGQDIMRVRPWCDAPPCNDVKIANRTRRVWRDGL